MAAQESSTARVWVWVKAQLTKVLIPIWARRDHSIDIPLDYKGSVSASDNLQRAMNLIMPLKDTSVLGLTNLTIGVGSRNDELMAGLNNVGNVHFARFDIIGDNLCMLSVYDGDFANYIRDFIVAIGGIFDVIMEFVVDPPPTPVREHTEEFIAWVHEHDIFQFPSSVTVLPGDLDQLPREVLLLMNRHRQIMIGLYHCYPGFSTAQIRHALGVGW